MTNVLIKRQRLNKHDDGSLAVSEPSSFVEGECVYYHKEQDQPALLVQIHKIHLDDEMVPYYSVRLPNGSEKQTIGRYLSSKDAHEDSINDKPVGILERIIPTPWSAFLFSFSIDVTVCALKEAAGEAFADLDLAHSLPRIGPWPLRLGLLWLVGILLRSDSLMRFALVGIKLFAVYYTLRLPYTCLTRLYGSPHRPKRGVLQAIIDAARNC